MEWRVLFEYIGHSKRDTYILTCYTSSDSFNWFYRKTPAQSVQSTEFFLRMLEQSGPNSSAQMSHIFTVTLFPHSRTNCAMVWWRESFESDSSTDRNDVQNSHFTLFDCDYSSYYDSSYSNMRFRMLRDRLKRIHSSKLLLCGPDETKTKTLRRIECVIHKHQLFSTNKMLH